MVGNECRHSWGVCWQFAVRVAKAVLPRSPAHHTTTPPPAKFPAHPHATLYTPSLIHTPPHSAHTHPAHAPPPSSSPEQHTPWLKTSVHPHSTPCLNYSTPPASSPVSSPQYIHNHPHHHPLTCVSGKWVGGPGGDTCLHRCDSIDTHRKDSLCVCVMRYTRRGGCPCDQQQLSPYPSHCQFPLPGIQ